MNGRAKAPESQTEALGVRHRFLPAIHPMHSEIKAMVSPAAWKQQALAAASYTAALPAPT